MSSAELQRQCVSLTDRVDELRSKLPSTYHSAVNKALGQSQEGDLGKQVQRLKELVSVLESCVEYEKNIILSIECDVANFKIGDSNMKELDKRFLDALSKAMSLFEKVLLESCFRGFEQLITLDFPSTFSTSSVISMNGMFQGCSNISSLNLSTFNTSNVTSISFTFRECSNINSLNLSTFNTSKVTSISFTFRECSNISSFNLSTFNTSNVTGMKRMFCGCSSLNSLNLSTFNKSNVRDMKRKSCRCNGLSSLDLSTLNTSGVGPNDLMCGCTDVFKECPKLKEVYLRDARAEPKLPRRVLVRRK